MLIILKYKLKYMININWLEQLEINYSLYKNKKHVKTNFNSKYLKSNFIELDPKTDYYLDSKFITLDGINQANKIKFVFVTLYDGHKLTFYLNNRNDMKEVLLYIRPLFSLIRFMSNVYRDDKMNAHIYFTKLKKLLPDNNVFDVENVNSGFTNLLGDRYIVVWRKEEWLKVLIHEFIHFYDIDGKNVKFINSFDQMGLCLESNKVLLLNEAITDFIAIHLLSSLQSFLFNLDYKNTLEKQIECVYDVCKRVLKHAGFTKPSDIKSDKCPVKLKETTNVMSYYVIKSVLFYNRDQFKSFAFNGIKINETYILNGLVNDLLKWLFNEDFNKLIANKSGDGTSLKMTCS